MKNKKGAMELSMGTMVTIVLVVAIIILGVGLVHKMFFNQPEFKIYEEKCWDEEVYSFVCDDGTNLVGVIGGELFDEVRMNGIWWNRTIEFREVCDTVEVDFINIDEGFQDGGINYPKQDLTTEWLVDNCEPSRLYIGDDIFIQEGDRDLIAEIVNTADFDKYEFKCGEDYTIEVIK